MLKGEELSIVTRAASAELRLLEQLDDFNTQELKTVEHVAPVLYEKK